MKGTVKFYDKTRNFGFITKDADGKDIYFTHSDIAIDQELKAGDRVSFNIIKKRNKMKAVKVMKE